MHTSWVSELAFLGGDSSPLQVVSSSFDGTCNVIDVASGHEVLSLDGHRGSVSAVVASPTHGIISGSFDGSIIVWEPTSGKMQKRLERTHDGEMVRCLSVFASLLASGGFDKQVRVWTLPTLAPVVVLQHSEVAIAVCFHPQHGGQLVVGNTSGTLTVWEDTS